MVWVFVVVLLPGRLSHATEIEGHWLAENPSGNSVLFYFGPESAFYMEDGSSWIQGTYTTQSNTMPRQLNLYIEEGSDVEDIGKQISYHYNFDAHLIVLTSTDQITPLDVESPSNRYFFIGYNLDSSDDDDDDSEFTFYASCFASSLPPVSSPAFPRHHRHSALKRPWVVSVSRHCARGRPY